MLKAKQKKKKKRKIKYERLEIYFYGLTGLGITKSKDRAKTKSSSAVYRDERPSMHKKKKKKAQSSPIMTITYIHSCLKITENSSIYIWKITKMNNRLELGENEFKN